MSFAQSSATVILVYCPPNGSIISIWNCRGAVQGRGRGLCIWSQQQRGWGNPGSTWKYNCRGCRLWQGAEPKCNRVPCPSWLPVAGAGEGMGRPLVHHWECLAAFWLLQHWRHGHSHHSWGLVCPPKRRNVCWLLHQPWAELDVCSSEGQSCAQLGVEFLLLTAHILSRLFLPFPSDLLQVFSLL